MLMEKDILPRFKNTKYFVEYLQAEPLLFKAPVKAWTYGVPKKKSVKASKVAPTAS